MMHDRNGPNSANRLLKELKELYTHAEGKLSYKGPNPSLHVEPLDAKSDGHHTWTKAQVAQFRACFASGTRERLAFELILGTGASRQDAATLGSANISPSGDISYTRIKTQQDTTIPLKLVPNLQAELGKLEEERAVFVETSFGKPFTPEGFGNFFAGICRAAGLPDECRAHGLRKFGATRLAEAGASEAQNMAFLAHKSPHEARIYFAKARRKRLVAGGLALAMANETAQPDDMVEQNDITTT